MAVSLRDAVGMAREGDRVGACAAYASMLQMDPYNATAAVFLAQLLLEDGRKSDGLEYIELAKEYGKDNGLVQSCIGGALYNLGDKRHYSDALGAMRRATSLCPKQGAYWRNRGKIASECPTIATIGEPMNCLDKALRLDRSDVEAYILMGHEFRNMKRFAQAKKCFEKAIALEPSNETAAFWLASMSSAKVARMPKHLVRELFNSYAGNFEEHLVKDLGYSTPPNLRKEVVRVCSSLDRKTEWKRCVDLGCGTGLMGTEFRKFVCHLVGVDLAKDMLPKATEAGYDVVVEADIFEWMKRVPTIEKCDACSTAEKGGELADCDDDMLSVTSVYSAGALESPRSALIRKASNSSSLSVGSCDSDRPMMFESEASRLSMALGPDLSLAALGNTMGPYGAHESSYPKAASSPPAPRTDASPAPAPVAHAPSTCSCASGPYDLILGGDLLVYIGDLEPFFTSLAQITTPDAIVALSTEVDLDSPAGGGGGGGGGSFATAGSWRVTPSGRFKHATSYVTGVAAKHGFKRVSCVRDVIRRNAGVGIPGDLVVFTKMSPGS